jgi:hypothetical protein
VVDPQSLDLRAGYGAEDAAAFTAIDVHYAVRKRISRVYLLDAAAETLIVAGLIVGWWLSRPVA